MQPIEDPDPLRIVVIGPGAVGSFLGGTLAAAGHDVTLLGRRPPGAGDATPGGPGVPAHGPATGNVSLEAPAGSRTVRIQRAHDPASVPPPDLVIPAVKAFDLDAALATAARWPGVTVLTVQNGVGAEDAALAIRDGAILAGSLTTAVELRPGGVRRLRTGGLGLAVVRGEAGALTLARRLAASWTVAGLRARVYDDWAAMKWSKLVANLVGNATSALLDMDPAEIYADPRTFTVERRQLLEAVAVMRAMHLRPVSLPGAHVLLLLRGIGLPEALARPVVARAIGGARGGKSPSLRLHLRGGGTGPSEVRWLNGAVAATGARLDLRVPVNSTLAALVEAASADPERAAWWRGRPDRLRDAIDDAAAGPRG
jgi:2-dehydropantoate 2-reductase